MKFKFHHLFSVAAILSVALLIGSCGHKSSKEEILSFKLEADSASMPQAVRLTSTYTPAQIAGIVVDWLKTADRSDGNFARLLSRDIMYQYISTGKGDDAEAYTVAVDSIKNTLPLKEQIKLFTVSATPVQLGRMVASDPEKDTLVPLIESEYAGDSLALAQFRNALASESAAQAMPKDK